MNGSRMTGLLPVLAVLAPQTVANAIKYSGVVDMSKVNQCMAILQLGDMAAETIDFGVYTCASDGTNPVLLKGITQLASSTGANDNKQAVIGVLAEELNAVSEATRYVKFGAVTGGATGGSASIVVVGAEPRYGPSSNVQNATVLQVVG